MHTLMPWNFFAPSSTRNMRLNGPAATYSRFNQALEQYFNEMFRQCEHLGCVAANAFLPNTRIQENEDSYEFSYDLPDFEEGNIHVSIESGMIVVRAEHKNENAKENGKRRHNTNESDRRFKTFFQSIPLPVSINAEKIEANYEDGLLTIRMPKLSEVLQPREIRVNSLSRSRDRDNADKEESRQGTRASHLKAA